MSNIVNPISEESILVLGTNNSEKENLILSVCQCKKMSATPNIQLIDSTDPLASSRACQLTPLEYATLNLDSGQRINMVKIDQLKQMKLLEKYWSNKSLGVILLLNFSDVKELQLSIESTIEMIKEFSPYLSQLSLSIGVTNNKDISGESLTKLNRSLQKMNYKAAVFELDLKQESDISILLESMLVSNIQGLNCINQ